MTDSVSKVATCGRKVSGAPQPPHTSNYALKSAIVRWLGEVSGHLLEKVTETGCLRMMHKAPFFITNEDSACNLLISLGSNLSFSEGILLRASTKLHDNDDV